VTSAREQWANFICSPAHAGRYLYASGDAAHATAAKPHKARVDQFLKRLARKQPDVRYLARLYYLTQPRVSTFFRDMLPDLVRSISHSSVGKVELSRRGARGKINWQQTLRARASGRGDAATLVVRRAVKSSDIPINRLLKLYLHDVSAAVAGVAGAVGRGALSREVEEVRRHADLAFNNPYISGVTLESRATATMRQAARRNRNRRYGELARLQAEFDATVNRNRWESILLLLLRGWIEPVSDDDLFELYILVMVLDVLEIEAGYGQPFQYGLIKSKRKEVARFRRAIDGAEVDVYFDQSPKTILGTPSEYMNIINQYDRFGGNPHRPDILLRFRLPSGTVRHLIIEVKQTNDPKYMRESIYKTLAYLKDFADLWSGAATQHPKTILAFSEAMSRKRAATDTGRDLVIIAPGERARLASLLEAAIAP
jgi:hypothetical protein